MTPLRLRNKGATPISLAILGKRGSGTNFNQHINESTAPLNYANAYDYIKSLYKRPHTRFVKNTSAFQNSSARLWKPFIIPQPILSPILGAPFDAAQARP